MKKTLIIALCASFLPFAAGAQENQTAEPAGTISYCLPSTSLSFEVEAVKETFHAGPYARFSQKYLGIDVRQKDEASCTLSGVKMTSSIEADQSSRYLLDVGSASVDASFLKLTSCGLVSAANDNLGAESVWRFPADAKGNFSEDGLISNVSSESAVLYHNVKGESEYSRVAVQQNIIVAKTLEKKAAETASLIFDLRRKRIQIITGDTDATYSGEAMGAAVEEIARLEKEYMTMFTGYSEYSRQKVKFEVVPEKDKKMYIAFRISDTAGLLPADNVSGKPVVLEIVPQEISVPEDDGRKRKESKVQSAVYRIPAVCTVKLMDGGNMLLQSRVPVYQYGIDCTFPFNVKVK